MFVGDPEMGLEVLFTITAFLIFRNDLVVQQLHEILTQVFHDFAQYCSSNQLPCGQQPPLSAGEMRVTQPLMAQRKAAHYVAEYEPSGAMLETCTRTSTPRPNGRLDAKHSRQEPGAVISHAGICAGGARGNPRPYRDHCT